MDAPSINTIIALISALVGGGIVKMVEVFLVARHGAEDYAAVLREELRKDNQSLKADVVLLEKRITELEHDRDAWREKYYNIMERKIDDRGTGEGGTRP